MATTAKSEKGMEKKLAAGLGKSEDKGPRKKKSVHVHIEPTSNKGFIVKHTPHEDGMPTGQAKTHVFAHAADMHKHLQKTFPAAAAGTESPAEEAAEAAAAPKTPAASPAPVPAPQAGM
jgi:hypothetical protein